MYFVIFKKKKDKDKDYRLYSNTLFDIEKKAEEFASKSMKRSEQYIQNIVLLWCYVTSVVITYIRLPHC